MSMQRTPMRWPPNLPNMAPSSAHRLRIRTTVCVASRFAILTVTSCSSDDPGRRGPRLRVLLPARRVPQHLPVEMILPRRCPSSRRPSTRVRAPAQSAFVDGDDPAFVFGFFLTPANNFASTSGSSSHPASATARRDADNSTAVAAECAKPARHDSELGIPPAFSASRRLVSSLAPAMSSSARF